jgi:hypothetical protein
MRTLISKRIKQEGTHLLEREGERSSVKEKDRLISDGSIKLSCTGSTDSRCTHAGLRSR